MKGRTMAAGALRSALAALVMVSVPALAGAETYDVDAVHSAVMFRAKRMDVVYVYGRFNQFTGTIEMSGEDVTSGKLALEVQTASVDTGNQRRDDHLRSPDFLNAAQLPAMTFATTGVRAAGERLYDVTGNLTLHGVTRPVTARVEHVGTGKDPRSGKTLMGFDATFTLRRSEFDMSFMVGPLSDEIEVHIALHAVSR